MKLHDHQKELVEKARQAIWTSRSICIVLPTGGGKTVVSAYIANEILKQIPSKDCCILYLFHRKELIEQTAQTFGKLGLADKLGFIQAGVAATPWAKIQLASVQTMFRRLQTLQWLKPVIIFADEAHHIRAKTWEDILDYFKDAFLVGLTATPARTDGKGLGTRLGKLVLGKEIRELQELGHLCGVRHIAPPIGVNFKSVKKLAGDYNKKQLAQKTTTRVMAKIVENWEKNDGPERKTLFFLPSIDISLQVRERLTEAGYPAYHLDGDSSADERASVLDAFKTGRMPAITSVDLFCEGFDAPDCNCVVLGRATMSTVIYRQQIGRGLRAKSDGGDLLVIDPVNNIDRHGPVWQPIDWSLEEGVDLTESKKTEAAKHVVCPHCHFVYSAFRRKCPNCEASKAQARLIEVDVPMVDRAESKPKRKATRQQLLTKVFLTGGDRNALEKIVEEYDYSVRVIDHWVRVFEDKWAKENARQEQNRF